MNNYALTNNVTDEDKKVTHDYRGFKYSYYPNKTSGKYYVAYGNRDWLVDTEQELKDILDKQLDK